MLFRSAVKDDSTGKTIARGDNPDIAINVAVSKGMPPENKEALQTEAQVENDRELAQTEANNAKAEETLPEAQAAQTEQQNTQYQSEGGADDDSGSTSSYYQDDGTTDTATSQYYENDGTSSSSDTSDLGSSDSEAETTYYENDGTSSSSIGTTQAGKSGTSSAKRQEQKPTRRLHNPLGDYSSYTHQITLYMITPDAYNAFIESGRKNINAFATAGSVYGQESYENSSSGAYIVAQSGGINNTDTHRAPGFELDYYIDNLEISSAIAMGKSSDSDGPTNTIDVKFQIIEPYGFSFISKLKTAQEALLQYVSSLPNVDKNPFADKQTYILGIKFLGYDAQGNLITGNGKQFDTYYDIKLKDFQFKLDGRTVVYNITAA